METAAVFRKFLFLALFNFLNILTIKVFLIYNQVIKYICITFNSSQINKIRLLSELEGRWYICLYWFNNFFCPFICFLPYGRACFGQLFKIAWHSIPNELVQRPQRSAETLHTHNREYAACSGLWRILHCFIEFWNIQQGMSLLIATVSHFVTT